MARAAGRVRGLCRHASARDCRRASSARQGTCHACCLPAGLGAACGNGVEVCARHTLPCLQGDPCGNAILPAHADMHAWHRVLSGVYLCDWRDAQVVCAGDILLECPACRLLAVSACAHRCLGSTRPGQDSTAHAAICVLAGCCRAYDWACMIHMGCMHTQRLQARAATSVSGALCKAGR
jgi:hypothetical protein